MKKIKKLYISNEKFRDRIKLFVLVSGICLFLWIFAAYVSLGDRPGIVTKITEDKYGVNIQSEETGKDTLVFTPKTAIEKLLGDRVIVSKFMNGNEYMIKR